MRMVEGRRSPSTRAETSRLRCCARSRRTSGLRLSSSWGGGTRLPNKGMKQTSVERIGRSQLIPGVRRTIPGRSRRSAKRCCPVSCRTTKPPEATLSSVWWRTKEWNFRTTACVFKATLPARFQMTSRSAPKRCSLSGKLRPDHSLLCWPGEGRCSSTAATDSPPTRPSCAGRRVRC